MKLVDGYEVIEHAEVNGEDREFIRVLTDYIEEADAVEPKQGEWIDMPSKMFKCSECGRIYQVLEPKNFCSNCGCRMKGADECLSK